VKNFIFGYGSLINKESATKTLGRRIFDEEILLCELNGYTRIWGVVNIVIVSNYMENKPVNAVFLDIRSQPGKSVNGVLMEITLDELERMDAREKNYIRIDVTNNLNTTINNRNSKVFTYVGKSKFLAVNYINPIVLKRYQNLVNKGARYFGRKFVETFKATTQSHNFKIVSGSYQFLDEQQNILTGNSFGKTK